MDEYHLQDILRFYGSNSSLSTTNLENLLHLITSRRAPASIDSAANPLRNAECLSVSDLLAVFGLANVSEVTLNQLELMCPAVLTQVLLPSCPHTTPQSQTIDSEVWGYGFLAVTIINLASLLGLLLIPFTKKSYFPKVLTYFIGVAIGTLFSNAVLQLIPEALGFDPKADDYVWKAVGIFGGFYILFFTEKVLKMALKADSEHCHAHFPTADVTIASFSNDIVINNMCNDVITNTINRDVVPNIPCDKTVHPTVSPVNDQVIPVLLTVFTLLAHAVLCHCRACRHAVNSDSSVQKNIKKTGKEACVFLTCRWLRGERVSNIKTVAWMITISDALHNFIDGLAIGASFTVSLLTGFSTSIAIVCEEFPHELGDFVILLTSGMSVPQAVFFNLLSAMCCYLGLVFGILLGSNFAPNVIFAIAGGMFLYISLADMFPEMNSIMTTHARGTRGKVIFFVLQNGGLITGFSVILLITMFAGNISLG
ncbi:metal cation symporter ZIP8 isoform X1 [Brachyhypopomus gauderio]|uniref:metal cation symporter ZIP8 isoform X1 n=1 Tax=Brachyhypopomus gauderio TaxID=698409 RepID=UPI0040423716